MTAIAGVAGERPRDWLERTCHDSIEAQSLYAKHSPRLIAAEGAAFAAALTDTTAEDANDRQPLSGGPFLLVADCRLDNRNELLNALGDPRLSGESSDSDIILSGWIRWQHRIFDRLAGPFAVAVFDTDTRTTTLARSPAGERPLCYRVDDAVLSFASMPSGLLVNSNFRPNFPALARSLVHGDISLGETNFEGVLTVPPAHFLECSPLARRTVRFWRPPPVDHRKTGDIVGEFRDILDLAVGSRLRRTAGPVASHLSSGLDSSGITATAAALLPDKRELIAFTMVPAPNVKLIVPPQYRADESAMAAEAAQMIGVEQLIVSHSGPLLDCLRGYGRIYQAPVPNVINHGWGAAIEARATASGATVLLSGSQGNATLSYGSMTLLGHDLMRGRPLEYIRQVRQFVTRQKMHWPNAIFWSLLDYIPSRVADPLRGHVPQRPSNLFIKPEWASRVRSDTIGSDYTGPGVRSDQYEMFSHHDPGIMFKASLADTGIDERDPCADRRLVEFCLSLPSQYYVRDGVTRRLARDGLSDRLPRSVIENQVRGYQGADWFGKLARESARDWVEEIAASRFAEEILDFSALRAALTHWTTIAALPPNALREWGFRFTRALAIGAFLSELERDYDRLGRRS